MWPVVSLKWLTLLGIYVSWKEITMKAKSLKLILLLALWLHFQVYANSQRVITAARICLRNSECNQHCEYCDEQFQCRRRHRKGQKCGDYTDCAHGLYCHYEQKHDIRLSQKELFEKCDGRGDYECSRNGNLTTTCSMVTKRCKYGGFSEDVCSFNGECQRGYFCTVGNRAIRGKCTRKLQTGSKCESVFTDHGCRGVCSSRTYTYDDSTRNYICATRIKIGEPCRFYNQCLGSKQEKGISERGISYIIASPITCNIPKDVVGTCDHVDNLIKKEGLKCNPSRDQCDVLRGLSCVWTPTGHRCMFNAFDIDIYIPFCDINGDYSKCNNWYGAPRECRQRHKDWINKDDAFKDFFKCDYKREAVPRGSRCNHREHVFCEHGTTCRTVSGVAPKVVRSPKPAQFCVAVKHKEENWFSKFRDACADGLKCHKNVCVEGISPHSAITHPD